MKKGMIFDLDGVIVDTAKYHALAWERLAKNHGLCLQKHIYEKLKGVSRMQSLEIILQDNREIWTEQQKEEACAEKNQYYLEYIKALTPKELLPGVLSFLNEARKKGYRLALGSASKNAGLILQNLQIEKLFDVIIDGNVVSKAKPNPEVFLKAADALEISAAECIVFEDAIAGIEAAHRAGMYTVGIGNAEILMEADTVWSGFNIVHPFSML